MTPDAAVLAAWNAAQQRARDDYFTHDSINPARETQRAKWRAESTKRRAKGKP
jgi:hypothetical protein